MPGLMQPRSSGTEISPDGKITTGGATQEDNLVVPDQSVESSSEADQTVNENQTDNTTDDTSIDFDAFSAAKNLALPNPLEVKEEKSKDEDTEEEKTAVKPKATPIDSQEDLDKPQPEVKVTKKQELPDKRDYTGIAPELVPHFKRMGNDAFAVIKPLLLAKEEEIKKRDTELATLRQGKTIIPDSYYEHEQAYVLTPEFQQANTAFQEAQVIANHWESQLNSVREGAKSFKPLVRDANGQLAYGADMPADASAETKLLKLFTNSQTQLGTYSGKLQAISESFKGNYSQAKQWVADMDNNTFPAFKDDKSVLSIAAKEYVSKSMPAPFRSNPLAMPLAKALVTTNEMYKLLLNAKQMLDAKGGAPAVKAKKQTNRQPTNNDINNDGGGSNNTTSEVSMDDFNKVKGV